MWVLRGGERECGLSVDQGEKARLLSGEEFLDHDLPAGIPETLLRKHLPSRRARLVVCLGDRDPLAGGEPVRLDHDGKRPALDEGFRRAQLGEPAIGRGRDAVARAQILGERLGAFQPRRRGGGAEGLDPGLLEAVDEAGHQRRLRTHDDEVDALLTGESEDAIEILRGDRHAHRIGGDSGVSRRAEKHFHQRRGGDRPAQGMLASPAADHQHPHRPRSPCNPRQHYHRMRR